jgi:hypothetical protein
MEKCIVAVSLAALIAVTMGQFYALIPRVTLPAVGCPTGGAAALRRPFSTDNDAMVAVSSFPKLTKGRYHLLSLIFSLFSLVLPFMVGSMCTLSNGATTTH